MEVKERNTIIILISFIIGAFLLVYPVPVLIMVVFSYNPLYYFIFYPLGYLCLDLLILAITLFVYAYFLLRPMNTLRSKKILSLGAMTCGSILVIFPVIAICIDAYFIIFSDFIFYWFYFGPILNLVLLIPGIALFVHGWFLKKNIKSGDKRK